jgi:type IV pilus assembly protein PilV
MVKVNMDHPLSRLRQLGTSLIEVLVAMVVLAIGLLGLVGLQARLNILQMESYQRAQALMLLHDMATRIESNRNAAASYITGGSLGVGAACPATGAARQAKDFNEWCTALQGAAETTDAGATNVGVMVGGRGCVQDLGSNRYLVTVAWQGLAPISAPPVNVTCGANAYTGGTCTGELCRRVVTTVVRISTL